MDEKTSLTDIYWNTLNNKIVEFQYSNEIFFNENFAWINVYCEEYFYLRKLMGLNFTFNDNEQWWHITIGKFRKLGQLGNFTDYAFLR